MDYVINDRIEVKSDVMGGKPVIKNTRLDVETVVGYLLAGDSEHDVLEAFPFITAEDIKACREFAARMSSGQYSVVAFQNAN